MLMIPLAIFRLAAIGRAVGRRAFQLYCYKEKYFKREIGTLQILSFACTPLYKSIFGKSADSLERSNERSGECTILYLCNLLHLLVMIVDNNPLIAQYVTLPKELNQLSCSSFVGGLLESILTNADYVLFFFLFSNLY